MDSLSGESGRGRSGRVAAADWGYCEPYVCVAVTKCGPGCENASAGAYRQLSIDLELTLSCRPLLTTSATPCCYELCSSTLFSWRSRAVSGSLLAARWRILTSDG